MSEKIEINGHPTWVETRGSGAETVLLLHGGLSNSDLLLDALSKSLETGYRVVAFDRRGHGYTADTAEPFHYEDMARETISVLEKVVGGKAHIVGWSDGGIVGLLVALRRPDLVDRLVLMGTNYHFDGALPMDFDPNSEFATMIFQAYAERSPDGGEHFEEIAGKFMNLVTSEPTLTVEDLKGIVAPTLVLVGDDDIIKLSHTAALYEALPSGQLSVVPASSHALPIERPAETARIILDFLHSDAKPSTLMSIRRK
jgi:pimeloyl-ACP methyl ester carboxylesterase